MKKLYIVGLGPGGEEYLTPKAKKAIEESSVIAGYKTYIDLILPLISEKTIISNGMMKEIERCRAAIEKAALGETVSLVCSGDSGVFGMASPAIELLQSYPEVKVEVVAGITAAQSGGAVLGAPLSHDFAVISLSDALTSQDVIEKRLRLAAQAGFCIALYNPQSKKRPNALKRACEILLSELSENTVCAYVKNIARDGEEKHILTLGELKNSTLDMFCTAFIGNEATRKVIIGQQEFVVTPRGYEKKYEL